MTYFRLIPLVAALLCVFQAIGAEHTLSVTAVVPPSWSFPSEIISTRHLPLNYSEIHGLTAQVATTIQHNGMQPGTPNHYLIALRDPVTLSREDETSVPMKVEIDGVALSSRRSEIWAEATQLASDVRREAAPGRRDAVFDIAQHAPGALSEGHYTGELNILLTPAL